MMPTPRATLVAVTLAVSVGALQRAVAQSPTHATAPYTIGERRTFPSRRLRETREVIVVTPKSYGNGGGRYPVLYVLDGGENALIAATAVRELAASARIPEMIVVCVVNTDRGRDFTPALVRTEEAPREVAHPGGADRFITFLGDELAPFIDAQYRTRPLRAVVGHSLGGLLAMHALATRPALFRRIITVDPSLWWDAGAEVARVHDALAKQPELRTHVAAVKGDSTEIAAMFGGAGPAVRATIVPLEGEAHEFLMYRGLYAGLIALFDDYYPAMRHDAGEATLASLDRQYAGLSRDFGYDVPIPMGALLEVANREANQRRFARAYAALDRAKALYPQSRTPLEWRRQVAQFDAEARDKGQGEVRTRVAAGPVPASVIEPLRGTWWQGISSDDPGFRAMTGVVEFASRGDTLVARAMADGVAFDGGPYRQAWAAVEVRGDTLRWDRENPGGGREITTVVRSADGRYVGTADIVDGHALPPGFTPPVIRIELRRRTMP